MFDLAARAYGRSRQSRPFGDPRYVIFRSLVLTGVILVTGFSTAGRIIDYISGADEVSGESAGSKITGQWRRAIREAIDETSFTLI